MIVRPTMFALLQRCATFAPWMFTAALIGGAMWLMRAATGSWLGSVLLFAGAGGAAIGYAAWAIECDWHGLTRIPRHAWRVAMSGANIHIRTRWLETVVPVDLVTSAEIVADGGWDGMKGIEEQCLVLRIASAPIISIPGSSVGFDEAVAGLRDVVRIRFRELGAE